jgi:hypothetical protein
MIRELLAPLAEDRRGFTFQEDFPGVTMGQGFCFVVDDPSYDDLVSVTDFEYDSLEATEGQPDHLEASRALQYGTIDNGQIPSGWTASARIKPYFEDTSEDSAEDTSNTNSEDSLIEKASIENEVLLWRRPPYDVEIKPFGAEYYVPVRPQYTPCHEDIHSGDQNDCFCLYTYIPMPEYGFIHSLSQTSRQLTAELGQCLWENAIVDFEEPELFLAFLEDRPQIWSRVKGITLSVCHNNGKFLNTSADLLLRISTSASQHLDLRLLSLRLLLDFNDLNDLPKLDDLNEWSIPFREFRVREKFTVIFRFHTKARFLTLKSSAKHPTIHGYQTLVRGPDEG